MGSGGMEARAAVPLNVAGLNEGTELTNVVAAATNPAGQGDTALDEAALPDIHVPQPSVGIALVQDGTPASEASFSSIETAGGAFAESFDTSGLYGAKDVIARACLGISCGFERAAVDLGPGITALDLTPHTDLGGQFSDVARFEARLVDPNDEPVVGQTVIFELAGQSAKEKFSVSTSTDGIATVEPHLLVVPGSYQLSARFDGSDDLEGSFDSTAFEVAPEETIATLRIDRRKRLPVLRALLVDRDDRTSGIGGREVIFYVAGRRIGRATTDSSGMAWLRAPKHYRSGTYRYAIRFQGDEYYRRSSASKRG